MTPEISSVAGLRSGIAAFMWDSFSHGQAMASVTHQEAVSTRIWLPDEVRVGWGVSEVRAAFVAS
jgi:hypothetical protein